MSSLHPGHFAGKGAKMKIIVIELAFLLLLTSCGAEMFPKGEVKNASSSCQSNSVTMSWDASMKDGRPHPDVIGYRIYVGTSSGNYQYTLNRSVTDSSPQLMHTLSGLGVDTYYFAVSAYSKTEESAKSNEVSKAFVECHKNHFSSAAASHNILDGDINNLSSQQIRDQLNNLSSNATKEMLIDHFIYDRNITSL